MDESNLLEKLRLIDTLFAGATTDGERIVAGEARKRIQMRLATMEREDPPIEYRFRMDDPWSRRLFIALCRRYEVQTYRYRGQRHSSIMARVSATPLSGVRDIDSRVASRRLSHWTKRSVNLPTWAAGWATTWAKQIYAPFYKVPARSKT